MGRCGSRTGCPTWSTATSGCSSRWHHRVVRLTDDLSATGRVDGALPGSDAPWGTGSRTYPGTYVTDGLPVQDAHGHAGDDLVQLYPWGLCHGVAVSETVGCTGHGGRSRSRSLPTTVATLIFRRFDGGLMLVLPNQTSHRTSGRDCSSWRTLAIPSASLARGPSTGRCHGEGAWRHPRRAGPVSGAAGGLACGGGAGCADGGADLARQPAAGAGQRGAGATPRRLVEGATACSWRTRCACWPVRSRCIRRSGGERVSSLTYGQLPRVTPGRDAGSLVSCIRLPGPTRVSS